MIITLSANNINIHFWKSNLINSINFNKLLESKENLDESCSDFNNNQFVYLEYKDKMTFGIYRKKLWTLDMTNFDWRSQIFNNNNNNNKEDTVENNNNQNEIPYSLNMNSEEINENNQLFHKNIFLDMDQNLNLPIQDKMEFIEKYIIFPLKSYINIPENNDEYNLELKEENHKIILEAIISKPGSSNNEIMIYSYITNLSSDHWKYTKVNNKYFIYNDNELHLYTFDLKSKIIQLQYRYNMEFVTDAIKNYNNFKLNSSEIDNIARPYGNNEFDELKKQDQLFIKYQILFYLIWRKIIKIGN